MDIKETLKHMWFGTKLLTTAFGVLVILYLLVASAPWLLVAVAGLWAAWFIGDMFK